MSSLCKETVKQMSKKCVGIVKYAKYVKETHQIRLKRSYIHVELARCEQYLWAKEKPEAPFRRDKFESRKAAATP